ncbi:MAG: phosphoribosylglycinamide formyltransferase [Gammaproteobacteria bacterium]|nr:phosphoribosylglycinamide formyltransferase [Gammaproteobacteria bacterium]
MTASLKAVVLISGRGSNLLAIADAIEAGQLQAKIALVLSNRPDAAGLELAAARGLATAVVDHRDFSSRAEFDLALQSVIDGVNPDVVVLAGFMRILGAAFVTHFLGRLVNIHPSLLPDYPGLNTHRRALEAAEATHGCSVHYVIPELDAGPVILQSVVPVLPTDSVESLAERVLVAEHLAYPRALELIAAGRVCLQSGEVWLDGRPARPEDKVR